MIQFKEYEKSALYLKERIGVPEIAVVLGSGLGHLAAQIENPVTVPYSDIPGFPETTVESHAGLLVSGKLEGRSIVMFKGRFHFYEGYGLDKITFYIRVLKLLGVEKLILTNAAGGVNIGYNVGDLMIISDHIKFFSDSPARGKNMPEFGNRFFDMTTCYSPRMRKIAKKCGKKLDTNLHEGVYFFMPGPEFETPAEIRAIRTLGGDAVGMSTVFEVVAASQCGIETLGISLITNMAAGIVAGSVVSDDEVVENANEAAETFGELMREIIKEV